MRPERGCTVYKITISTIEVNRIESATHLLRYSSPKLPSNAGLDCEDYVVHVDFARASCKLGVDESIGEDLGGVSVREFEELM